LGGPLYALDGTPLADAAHASVAPAPLATEPVEPPREVSAAGLAAAASAAAKLVHVASSFVQGPQHVFGAWSIADTDLAIMLSRLVHLIAMRMTSLLTNRLPVQWLHQQ
jgi:hypothetical protein